MIKKFLEVCWVFRYYFLVEFCHTRDLAFLRAFQYLGLALIVGFIYFDSGTYHSNYDKKITVLHTSRIITSLLSSPFLSRSVTSDRNYLNVGLNGLMVSPESILISKFVIEVGYRNFLLLLYSFIVYPLTALLPFVSNFALFVVILWIHQFANTTLGFFISASIKSRPWLADIVVSAIALFNLLFSGGLQSTANIPPIMKWIKFSSTSYLANQALLQNQFGGHHWHGIQRKGILEVQMGAALVIMIGYGVTLLSLSLLAFRLTSKR